MSKTYVPQALRQKVAEQARHCCGYCLTAQRLSGMLLTIEHLLPEARGGKTEEDNLWLACVDCDDYKGDRIEAVDPVTGEVVKLFDPRHQRWGEHFAWNEQGDEIVGLTASGRATVVALRLNRPFLVQARQVWVKVVNILPRIDWRLKVWPSSTMQPGFSVPPDVHLQPRHSDDSAIVMR